MLRTCEVKYVFFFGKNRVGFNASFDVTKFLHRIPDLFHTCAPCSEVPSNISAMKRTKRLILVQKVLTSSCLSMIYTLKFVLTMVF